MAQIQPDITNFTDRKQRSPSPPIVQKGVTGVAVQEEPARASPSQIEAGLETLKQMVLEKTIHFDPQPVEQHLDANGLVSEAAVPKPTSAEIPQPQWREKVVTANASTAPSSVELLQETKLQPEPDRSPQREPKGALIGTEPLTNNRVLQIRSRLRDLGFLTATKGGEWDARARDALRDFKIVNHLRNDDVWDLDTSKKLDSQTAIRADQSIIGSWSTGPCRSTKTTDIRLSISSRQAKSSAGSVCEFRDLQWTNHEWRVKANCSQGTQHYMPPQLDP